MHRIVKLFRKESIRSDIREGNFSSLLSEIFWISNRILGQYLKKRLNKKRKKGSKKEKGLWEK